MEKEIDTATRVQVGIDFLKWAGKMSMVLIPIFAGFLKLGESRFHDYMTERDERIVAELTEGIAGTTIALERLELGEYHKQDSIMFERLLAEHYAPAMDLLLSVKNGIEVSEARINSVSQSVRQIEMDFAEYGRDKRSKAEQELAWYKSKEKRDDIERRLDERLIDLSQKKDSTVINEIQRLRKTLERHGLKSDRIK